MVNITELQCGQLKVAPFEVASSEDDLIPAAGFHVELRKKGRIWRNCTIFPTNSSCLFEGLKSETEYETRVRGFNLEQTSDWTNETTTTGFIGRQIR